MLGWCRFGSLGFKQWFEIGVWGLLVRLTVPPLCVFGLGEYVDFLLPGPQEIEEVQATVLTGLADAQKGEVFFLPFFGRGASDYITDPRVRLNCVLSIVVVPRDPVMAKECEEFIAVPFKTLRALFGHFAPMICFAYFPIEPVHTYQMLLQKIAFQAETIYGSHYRSKKVRKRRDHLLQFSIEWIVKDLVVQISHQMNEAPLLKASDRIIRGVEIGYQNALESSQKFLGRFSLSVVREDIHHVAIAGQDPDKCGFAPDVRPRFVRVD